MNPSAQSTDQNPSTLVGDERWWPSRLGEDDQHGMLNHITDAKRQVPQTLDVRHGVFVVENLDTGVLAADHVREFAFILTHPKLRGATGACASPIAMV